MNIIDKIKNRLLPYIESLLFKMNAKDSSTVFFYPHPNCKNDRYDIIHYHSDNVLCLLNYIIRHHEYDYLKLFVVVYDISLIENYKKYVEKINSNSTITFINDRKKLSIIRAASMSSLIFTDTGHTYFRNKTKKQKLVCLNYFIPFKNDFIENKKSREERVHINNLFDCFLMTAALPARVSACDKGIPLSNFLLLGFCRNDVFCQSPTQEVKLYLSSCINNTVSKFIVFTPTYRDYEEKEKSIERDIFGYDGTEYTELERVLEENQAVLLAKLHPKQSNIKVNFHNTSRIIYYRDLEDNPFTLYQYLAEADGLITDYTSTYFDFLHRDRPVIFNFYDFDRYKETRGFGFEPIKSFCAGDIVTDSNSFVEAVTRILCGKDVYREERRKVAPIFDNFYDCNNTKRICDYFLKGKCDNKMTQSF